MANTELAEKKESIGALVLAGSFEEDAGDSFSGMGQDDFALPFLRLLTNTSPEVGEVEGALPGMVYNSVTGQLFDGKKGIVVIPCAYVRQYIEWAPRGSGSGAPLNIYPSTSDILSRTHREPGDSKDYLDNGNYIDNTANHYVMVVDSNGTPSPALVSMKSTQLKKSRKWNSMMQSVKMQGRNGLFTPPMYSQLYRLTTVPESNDKGKWFGWEIERVGAVDSPEVYAACRAFAQSVNSGAIKAKPEAEGEAARVETPF
jgi:hypothetical protein